MAGLPTPEQIRERSLRCREAAMAETDIGRRRILAKWAFSLAQIAEHIERGKPVDTDVVQSAIDTSDLVLGEPSQARSPQEPPSQQVTANERSSLDRIGFLRQKAAECRAIADQLMFRETRAMYRRLADNYDTIADTEEKRLAGPAAKWRESGSPQRVPAVRSPAR